VDLPGSDPGPKHHEARRPLARFAGFDKDSPTAAEQRSSPGRSGRVEERRAKVAGSGALAPSRRNEVRLPDRVAMRDKLVRKVRARSDGEVFSGLPPG